MVAGCRNYFVRFQYTFILRAMLACLNKVDFDSWHLDLTRQVSGRRSKCIIVCIIQLQELTKIIITMGITPFREGCALNK